MGAAVLHEEHKEGSYLGTAGTAAPEWKYLQVLLAVAGLAHLRSHWRSLELSERV